MIQPLTLTDRGSHSYLIPLPAGYLLFDPGWPGALPQLRRGLKSWGVPAEAVRWVMFSHHHPDHAGLTQEVKNAFGARLLIHKQQIPFLPALGALYAQKSGYTQIVVAPQDVVLPDDNRAILAGLGISGQALLTPGHSDDSLSLVLDGGPAFTGDLHLPGMVDDAARPATLASWQRILAAGAQMIYPGHGLPLPASRLEAG